MVKFQSQSLQFSNLPLTHKEIIKVGEMTWEDQVQSKLQIYSVSFNRKKIWNVH
jgi:hypothetical protein